MGFGLGAKAMTEGMKRYNASKKNNRSKDMLDYDAGSKGRPKQRTTQNNRPDLADGKSMTNLNNRDSTKYIRDKERSGGKIGSKDLFMEVKNESPKDRKFRESYPDRWGKQQSMLKILRPEQTRSKEYTDTL